MEYDFGEDRYIITQDFHGRIKYEKWSKINNEWTYQESLEVPYVIFKKYLRDFFGM